MKELPLISVIVPIHCTEKFLSDCIKSVLQQTHENFELILVDDASPDNCGKICDEYAEKDERIKVVHQSNTGASGARNTGLEIAKGEYIVFLDSDDIAHSHLLEFLLQICLENDVKMAIASFEELAEDGVLSDEFIVPKRSPVEIIDPYTYLERLCTVHQILYVVPWSKIYHKSIYADVRFPVGALNEDDCVIDELIYKAERIGVEYVPLVYYRKNPTSLSRVGITAQQWLASVPYKQKRMATLRVNSRFELLYTVQRLYFYDLLLEREKHPDEAMARAEFLNLARSLFAEIIKNPKSSKKETLNMLKLFIFPSLIKKYEHSKLLIQG